MSEKQDSPSIPELLGTPELKEKIMRDFPTWAEIEKKRVAEAKVLLDANQNAQIPKNEEAVMMFNNLHEWVLRSVLNTDEETLETLKLELYETISNPREFGKGLLETFIGRIGAIVTESLRKIAREQTINPIGRHEFIGSPEEIRQQEVSFQRARINLAIGKVLGS